VEATRSGAVRVFAYGSNLCLQRMLARAPQARVVAVGAVAGHLLRWHKIGRDGSGKCDAWASGDDEDVVWGAVYEMPAGDKRALDRFEGLGEHYVEKTVRVRTPEGRDLDAAIYVATPRWIREGARPWCWYRDHVLTGARQHGLPEDYVAALERTAADDDPDRERHARESALRAAAADFS